MPNNFEKIEKGLADLRKALKSERLMDVEQNQALLLSIKALSDCRPTPCWIKGTNGRMLYINPAYEKEFGIQVDEYMGEKDSEKWEHPIAVHFRDNDSVVIKEKRAMKFIEDVPINGVIIQYRILKWPVYLNGHLVGVAGESLGKSNE